MTSLRVGRAAIWVCLACVSCAIGGAPGEEDVGPRERAQQTSLHVEVTVIDDAVRGARHTIESRAGYCERSVVEERSAHLELRVPSEALDDVRMALGELGRVTRSSDEAEDVTIEHADQELQLASARAEEAR